MTDRDNSLSQKTFPWFRGGFDLEGIVGFLAAWLLGVLLGMVWGPLFWLAFIPGIMLLFATRTAERVTSNDPAQLVAPCDGVVVSVEEADAPNDLRMNGPCLRIRISSSPFSANNVHAPIAGAIDRVDTVEGEPKTFAAMQPDAPGLSRLFMAFSGDEIRVGLAAATGGLGPRLVLKCDAGDRVRKGRTVATRRLGGWCDLYMPLDAEGAVFVEPGRILVGGETVLWDFSRTSMPDRPRDTAPTHASPPEEESSGVPGAVPSGSFVAPETVPPEAERGASGNPRALQAGQPYYESGTGSDTSEASPEIMPEAVAEETGHDVSWLSPPADEGAITPDVMPPEVADDAGHEPQSAGSDQPQSGGGQDQDSETASMFERLRREARKLSGEDEGSGQ